MARLQAKKEEENDASRGGRSFWKDEDNHKRYRTVSQLILCYTDRFSKILEGWWWQKRKLRE